MRRFVTILFLMSMVVGVVHAEKVAVVTKVQGDVLIQKAEDLDYNTPAAMGTILENNDQIKITDGFAVLLLLDDKSQVKLRENTEVGLSLEEDLSGSAYHVRLNYGQALTKYEKGAEFNFQLHTPTSVASIKGTEFWTITDPETGDQVIVLEGQVDVMNNLTGMISTAGPGETVTSSTDGYIDTGETDENAIPEEPDSEETEGSGDAEEEEGEEEEELAASDSTAMEEVADDDTGAMPVVPPSTVDSTTPEDGDDAEAEEEEDGEGLFGDALAMDAAFGAVTIDGQLYNQIALRPDISVGKLGLGLDLVIYMNQDGDIRTEDWDPKDPATYVDKVMYVRWGEPQDPLYIRVGTLENVVMGYGLFVNGYNNMMEYPSVKKIGTHFGFTVGSIGVEAMVANAKEAIGLTSLRTTYSLGKLKFGATMAMDYNQYLGFKDADDDGRPDLVDDFPDDPNYWLDSDGDGLEDVNDLDNDNDGLLEVGVDADGDGIIDGTELIGGGLPFDNDGTYLKPEPFDLTDKKSTLTAVSVDVGYPVFSSGFLDVMVFAEAGSYLGSHYNYTYSTMNGLDSTEVTHGWGLTAPGIRATIMKIVNVGLEYRMTGENFAYGIFDQNYDIDRVGMQAYGPDIVKPITRDARLLNTTAMQGVFGSLSVDVLSMVTVNGAYQHMMQDGLDPVKGLYGSINLAKDLVPKLAGASAYLNRMNVDDPFDIYNEGTLMGYKVVFELGGGATLTWDFRQTFRDLDGNGEINMDEGSDEVIKTTVIETGFSF